MSRLGEWGSSLRAAARAHPLFTGLLLAGLVLRIVTFFAYRPALIYFDSTRYLRRMEDLLPGELSPVGYPFFLRVLPIEWEPAVVPAVQHLFGLAIAVLLYAVLVRLEVRPAWAAIATAPVLLDGYQLNIEQFVLTEALLEMLIVGGCALLFWRRPPATVALVFAGLAFASAAIVRSNAVLMIGPALIALLFLRPRHVRVAAFVAAAILPLLAYAAWFESEHGRFGLNGYGGRFLYARVAPIADCSEFDVPERERILCPDEPLGERPKIAEFMWSREKSPVFRLEVESERERTEIAGSFARRVIRNQPLDYAEVLVEDLAYGFSPTKSQRDGDPRVSSWQFQEHYPILDHPTRTRPFNEAAGFGNGRVSEPLAKFLRVWQRFVYTPGPLLAIALLLGLAGVVAAWRARRSELAAACLMFTFMALAIYGSAVAVSQFSWRYQLPLLVFLPPAGALGLTALTQRTERRPAGE